MDFYADLHVHSKYSRATSRDSDLEHMALWACKKGVGVLGTGDFTHPAWFGEIEQKLAPAEPGLWRLRDDIEREVMRRVPSACAAAPRFVLETEISTIYKRAGQTRKVHHLIFASELDHVRRMVGSLSRIGNLKSDGRPILGLDSRDLLEIVLESGADAFLAPAHIWTPWFSALGSKSGFDAIADCYADLADHIFAAETGLSSDPPMNWRVSALDRYRLISNSDAHSPGKIAREACRFRAELSYPAIRRALATGEGYGGTIEFFPEEGKYHLDGHRACGVRLEPPQTKEHNGRCPRCGKPLTVGVLYRVEELADRPDGAKPADAAPYRCCIPLAEMLAEILGVGPDSRAVQQGYEGMLSRLGAELPILESVPTEEIRRGASPLAAEAILRMREGRVRRQAGFDGEYGVIKLFDEGELGGWRTEGLGIELGTRLRRDATPGQARSSPAAAGGERGTGGGEAAAAQRAACVREEQAEFPAVPGEGLLDALDPEQREAAGTVLGPLLIVAGPGTGKTRTLTHRIAHLIAEHGARPDQCLAITFTRRAAGEMRDRLRRLVPDRAGSIAVVTFHSLGLLILREHGERLGLPVSFRVAGDAERQALAAEALSLSEAKARRWLEDLSRLKRAGLDPESDSDPARTMGAYAGRLREAGLVDFDDLIAAPLKLLGAETGLRDAYRRRFPWISVDEYQDVDEAQYRLIRLLAPADANLCAIGDPDQAIYGFRGTDVRFFQRFREDFPSARIVTLKRNYRSVRPIVDASLQLVAPASLVEKRAMICLKGGAERVTVHEAASDRAEAEFIVHTIERMVGGSTFFSMDSGRVGAGEGESPAGGLAFCDFAVLYRTEAQSGALAEAFARSGLPFQRRSHGGLADDPQVAALLQAMQAAGDGGTVRERLAQAARAVAKAGVTAHADGDARGLAASFAGLAEECGSDLNRFLSEIAVGSDVDLWDPRAQRVPLLTLHAAKGMEFEVVFMAGCEEGLLPLHWGAPLPEQESEERRLFFVGMTRARRRLFLLHARKRMVNGRMRERAISPFLRDVEEALLERGRDALRAQGPRARQLELL